MLQIVQILLYHHHNVEILTTFPGFCTLDGTTVVLGVPLCGNMASASGVVLGVGRLTIAVVTVSVLLDLLFELPTAFKLDRDVLLIAGRRI